MCGLFCVFMQVSNLSLILKGKEGEKEAKRDKPKANERKKELRKFFINEGGKVQMKKKRILVVKMVTKLTSFMCSIEIFLLNMSKCKKIRKI